MTRTIPTVWVRMEGGIGRATLERPGAPGPPIRLDSPAWFGWLEATTTRSFAYPIDDPQVGYIRGFMTVRKERRARGTGYWVVYRRCGRTLQKVYLGRSQCVTAQQLASIAASFLAMTVTGRGTPERERRQPRR